MQPLVPAPEHVREARDYARSRCREHGFADERCDDVVLVLSELVGNAIRHGVPPLSYGIEVDGEDIVVLVEDADGKTPCVTTSPSPAGGESGRGLLIVQELARHWGWSTCPNGKRVWARL